MICDLRNTDLFPPRTRICIANHVSTPRWFMSVFLLKSDGGTPQSIFFNVFIILKCSINREINLWHVNNPGVSLLEVVAAGELGFFQLRLSRIIYARPTRSESRNLLDQFTAHRAMTPACWWAKWDEARLWCGTDWVSRVSMTRVFRAKNSIWSHQSQGFPSGSWN